MKLVSIVTAAVLSCVAPFGDLSASADSSQATCEVRKHGDKIKDASGPCSFSQRQGYVDIRLRNGDSYSLSPTDEPNHFRDQEGHKVERTKAGGDEQKYEWDHRKIIVNFSTAPASGDDGDGDESGSAVSGNAKSACMQAVNGNYGGDVRDLKVVRSEFSQANSEVIVDAVGVRGGSKTERWKCLVSNDGKIQEVRIIER